MSNTTPALTTGQLKTPSNDGVKTIYAPSIWTDSKLDKAAREALSDAAKKNVDLIDGQFRGVTKDGFEIEGYLKDGKVDTFYN
ncbi:CdiA family toxin C-terminal domain-containing protein [Flammeovirga kamogawensis]|uniref:CdiA family toxin C-terminal domain-containing protein n=1 Tax=Flammeovirga kamogawensis TaxID=373891 RepID=UPI0017F679F2|nr:CdiA family toxin C-terminal domain-containing protein [Flammeovirga kamogawensis]MBB6461894.1 hypothetical protein [Flammeovirga kamogawensis]